MFMLGLFPRGFDRDCSGYFGAPQWFAGKVSEDFTAQTDANLSAYDVSYVTSGL